MGYSFLVSWLAEQSTLVEQLNKFPLHYAIDKIKGFITA